MKIGNKKAFFDYQITDRLEAGINLLGAEVKAIRLGHADLSGSFVRLIGNEAYLLNAKIFPYKYAAPEGYDENRTRKLLLHKKEIISLKGKTDGANLAIVPISLYLKNGYVKVELGLGKGKKKYEKKEAIKAKDIERDIEQDLAS
ncbi:MAG: SsrA-binding protein SmpB [Candidatus Levyibacteriota bacterium]